jgi:hypothetical protein
MISRRQFLAGAAAALGGSALLWTGRPDGPRSVAGQEPAPTSAVYLPYVAGGSSAPLLPGKVVHVHSASATDWSGESDYWNHLDQSAINDMVDRGLIELTGAATVIDAWRALIPAYQPGEKVAIKVNFNNTRLCDSTITAIDALIEPVNAVARGLVQMGVAGEDICVYDAVRALPDRFVSDNPHGLSFYDGWWEGACRDEAGFTFQPESRVTFYPPPDVTAAQVYVTNLLMNATYLINMPIMKGTHPLASVTLGFKNHFGSLNNPAGLHSGVDVVGKPSAYRTDYNPLVDLLRSPLIGGKTVLTVGDGLFAARQFSQPPVPWTTFEDQLPNSLFFARDPVAIDCVMHDLLAAEPGTNVIEGANNYLRLAGEAGLGIFEQGDPGQMPYGSGYTKLQYARVEL